MKPEQKKIYYITQRILIRQKSTAFRIFRKKDVEVLLLHDRVDEWLVGHLAEFDGKPLQSVAKGDVNLDEIATAEDSSVKEEQQKKKSNLRLNLMM